MIRHGHLDHRFVEEIPDRLAPGLLYISMRYATAVHLCCCGCGREVVTPFSPAQWRITYDGESVSLHPSIGSWLLPCRSHYVIQGGRVIEAGQWDDEQVATGQARDRHARTAYYASKAAPIQHTPTPTKQPPRKGWLTTLRELLGRLR
jgi:hypothetical protein